MLHSSLAYMQLNETSPTTNCRTNHLTSNFTKDHGSIHLACELELVFIDNLKLKLT